MSAANSWWAVHDRQHTDCNAGLPIFPLVGSEEVLDRGFRLFDGGFQRSCFISRALVQIIWQLSMSRMGRIYHMTVHRWRRSVLTSALHHPPPLHHHLPQCHLPRGHHLCPPVNHRALLTQIAVLQYAMVMNVKIIRRAKTADVDSIPVHPPPLSKQRQMTRN